MAHPLDNAAWFALTGPQRQFGLVGELCARYRPGISPIAALAEETDAAFDELATITTPGQVIAISCDRTFPERHWQSIANVPLSQWWQSGAVSADPSSQMLTLGANEREEMLALARLADPGPFELDTWQLGTYYGIRVNGELVAMAGERMRLPGYAEVSAVATRPGHEGRGYAQTLVRALLVKQAAAGERAFLHVRTGSPSERGATRVYEKLGFELRTRAIFRVVRRL